MIQPAFYSIGTLVLVAGLAHMATGVVEHFTVASYQAIMVSTMVDSIMVSMAVVAFMGAVVSMVVVMAVEGTADIDEFSYGCPNCIK
jgi:hypothetical protein